MKRVARMICCILASCLISSCILNNPSYAYGQNVTGMPGQAAKAIRKPALKAASKTAAEQAGEQPAKYLVFKDPEPDESDWYCKNISMKKEHQKVLWDYCKSRNLDYMDMLALIYTESNFNEKCSTGTNKGYFQIGKGHFNTLSKSLKTPNKPLDGKININWGTALYSWILEDKRVKNLTGKKKRDVALSIFQRGTGGYDRYGINYKFLKVFYKKKEILCSYFKK